MLSTGRIIGSFRPGTKYPKGLKSSTVAAQLEAHRPPPPKLSQKHENPAEAGKYAGKLLGRPLPPWNNRAPETQKPNSWLGRWREAVQNCFPISNSSFNIAHFRRFWTRFSRFISGNIHLLRIYCCVL